MKKELEGLIGLIAEVAVNEFLRRMEFAEAVRRFVWSRACRKNEQPDFF